METKPGYVGVRLSLGLKAWLEEEAARQGVSTSTLVRRWCEQKHTESQMAERDRKQNRRG